MLKALVYVVPGVDKDGTTVFMDGFRGCEQSLEAFNADVNRTICVKHRAEVIKKNLGAEDAKTALAAIYAKSPGALEKAKSKFSSRTKTRMAKTLDEEQYPCLHANIGHHTTSQGAESGNKSNLDFHKSHFGDIFGLAAKILFRFEGRKKYALEWSAICPQNV